MGQLFFTDQNGRRWMCGWDNPSQGYYALRQTADPTAEEEFDIYIDGFGDGIPTLGDFTAKCYEHGFELTMEQVKELADDRARQERPLTPLQQLTKSWLDGMTEQERKHWKEE